MCLVITREHSPEGLGRPSVGSIGMWHRGQGYHAVLWECKLSCASSDEVSACQHGTQYPADTGVSSAPRVCITARPGMLRARVNGLTLGYILKRAQFRFSHCFMADELGRGEGLYPWALGSLWGLR